MSSPCHKNWRSDNHVSYPEGTNGYLAGCCRECDLECICARLVIMRNEAYRDALSDALAAVINCDDYPGADNMLIVDAYREGLEAARESIQSLMSK